MKTLETQVLFPESLTPVIHVTAPIGKLIYIFLSFTK